MRTAFLLSFLLSISILHINAENNKPTSQNTCLACSIPGGLALSDLTANSATLSWNSVGTATQYTLEVEDEQNGPSNFQIETNVNGTTYALNGLTAGVLYKFKVRSRCGGDKSDWSDWFFFTTSNNGNGQGGACQVPVNLSAMVNGASATLSWSTVAGALQYDIEVEDEQNNPSTFHLEVSAQDSFYVLNGLSANVLYKFKVRTNCTGGQSDWSTWLFFNGNAGGGSIGGWGGGKCIRPTGAAAINITLNSTLLTWNPIPGTSSYTLEIERNQNGTAFWQILQVVDTNFFLLTGLDEDTRYKFKVRSSCSVGQHSSWTKWVKFTTLHSVSGTPGNSNAQQVLEQRRETNQQVVSGGLDIRLWPNPVQFSTNIQVAGLVEESAKLRLFDLAGRLVLDRDIQSTGNFWEGRLDLDALENGIYLLRIEGRVASKTIKLVISH